jgi:energy-coupling factor transporter ATP-binding protein EcfA2
MLTYSARLMAADQIDRWSNDAVNRRVSDLLQFMELERVQQRTIPERISSRGVLAKEIRLLSIAIALVALPQVMVLDNPTEGLEPAHALHLYSRLKFLADNGYTVVTTVNEASQSIFGLFDRVVLLCEGYSVFSGDSGQIIPYFTSPSLNYSLSSDSNLMDFLLDVSACHERPLGSRCANDGEQLWSIFMNSTIGSQWSEKESLMRSKGEIKPVSLLPDCTYPYYGYFTNVNYRTAIRRSVIIIERTFVVKIKEFEILRKSIAASVVMSIFLGYFMLDVGSKSGDYCMSLTSSPYPYTTNLLCTIFMTCSFCMMAQIISAHAVCQKIALFRYERKAGVASLPIFWIATVVSEMLFAAVFVLIYSVIVYFLTELNDPGEILYFIGVMICLSAIGISTTLMLAAIFKGESIVKDLLLASTYFMLFLSGSVFPLPVLRDYLVTASQLNPIRWSFEALSKWRFKKFEDGEAFLARYDFQNFDEGLIFEILFNFVFFSCGVFFLALFPRPKTLKRQSVKVAPRLSAESDNVIHTSTSIDATKSLESGLHNLPLRESTVKAPLLLARDSSFAGGKRLETNSLTEDPDNFRGPNISFVDIRYRVRSRASPSGYNDILQHVTGQFEWGNSSLPNACFLPPVFLRCIRSFQVNLG